MTREDPVKHFFLWPAVLVVLAIAIFPLIFSLANSFMSLRLVPPRPAKFVGFENYIDLLSNERFWQVVKTTSLISFTSVALQFIIGFAIALALVKRVRGADFFRVSFLLPMLVAPVAVALVAKQILNPTMGPLNQITSFFGFSNLPFLTDATWALGSLIAVEIWQWTPFVILLLLAGLQGLPDDVYEAAELENASPWRQFWTITFPMMLPISVAVIFIRIVESFKIIDTVFVMTGGGPGIATETLTLFAYQEGFKKFNLGYTSALSFLFLAVVLIMSLIYLAILKPYLERYK
jgi:multiple sugar transport system permease protein